MGPWDGLDFTQIRETWPELYARRASEPLLVPPGAETLAEVQARALPALTACLEQSEGDIALVAHASVVQAILAAVTGTPLEESRPLRPPYTGYAVLDYDGALHLVCRDRLPAAPLTPELAGRLLAAAGPGVRIEAHCRAVAADALRIAEALPLSLDRELLVSAALLHDVARREREHAKLGAAWLQELGYPRAAALVARHHDLQNDTLDETALLFLADKCVREDRRVRLEDRFSESAKRYTTPEALAAHAGRLAAAQAIRNKVNLLAGRRVVD